MAKTGRGQTTQCLTDTGIMPTPATPLADMSQTASMPRIAGRARVRRDPFHLWMAFAMIAVLAIGFGLKGANNGFSYYLGHREYPMVLHAHSAVFTGWLLLYVAQVTLVYRGNTRWHRQLGLASLPLIIAMPPLGIITAVVMRRFDLVNHIQIDTNGTAYTFLAIMFWDMIIFTSLMVAGLLLRRKPMLHRRLMFLATLSMMHAGLARLSYANFSLGGLLFYLPDHLFIALTIWHEWRKTGRVHRIYKIVWPLWFVGQIIAMFMWLNPPAFWLNFCRALVGV